MSIWNYSGIQSLGIFSRPTFRSVTLTDVAPGSLVGTDANSTIQALNFTSTTGCTGTVVGSNFMVDTPQDLRPNASPSFNTLTCGAINSSGAFNNGTNTMTTGNINCRALIDTGLTISMPVKTNAGKQLMSGAISLATTDVVGTLPINKGGTGSNTALSNNRIMVSSGDRIIESAALTNGQIMVGSTGNVPVVTTLTGTPDQVNVATGPGTLGLSLPQAIAQTSSPQFAGLNIQKPGTTSGLTLTTAGATSSFTRTDEVGTFISDAGGGYFKIAGQATYTNNNTLDDGKGNMSIAGLTANMPVKSNGTKQLVSSAIALASDVTGMLPVTNGGTGSTTSLVGNRLMCSNGTSIVEASALTNGQIFIGQTGNSPIAATIAGTTRQVYVTNTPGGITLSLPQPIDINSFPQFGGLNLQLPGTGSGLTLTTAGGHSSVSREDGVGTFLNDGGSGLIKVNGGVTSTNNNILDDSYGNMTVNSLNAKQTGTTSRVTLTSAGGTSSFNRIDGIGTFMDDNGLGYIKINGWTVYANNNTLDDGKGNMTITGLTANMPVKSNGAKVLVSGLIDLTSDITGVLPTANGGTGAMTNGQLLIGRTGNTPIAATLTGTANQIDVTNTSGTIKLSGPQNLSTTSSPTFTGLNLSGLTAIRPVFTDGSNNLVTSGPIGNGQLIIGVTGGIPVVGNINGTVNGISVALSAGSITLSLRPNVVISNNIESPVFYSTHSCHCRVDDSKGAPASIPNITWTLVDWIPFSSSDMKKSWSLDPSGMIGYTRDVTIPQTGVYKITAQVRLADALGDADDVCGISIYVNGVMAPDAEVFSRPDNNPGRHNAQIIIPLPLNAGDIVNFYTIQACGSALHFKWLTFSVERMA